MKILVTGSAGFINGYLIQELLDAGHTVVGLDNFSKYGRVEKSYDKHPQLQACRRQRQRPRAAGRTAGRLRPLRRLGGDDRRHQLLPRVRLRSAGRERAHHGGRFDAAIRAHKHGKLQKITVVSSSMVFENTTNFPRPKARSAAARRPVRPTASRSWRPNTSRRAHGSSISCRTRLRGRSTVSALARSARWRTATS